MTDRQIHELKMLIGKKKIITNSVAKEFVYKQNYIMSAHRT